MWWQSPYFMAAFGATVALGFVVLAVAYWLLKHRVNGIDVGRLYERRDEARYMETHGRIRDLEMQQERMQDRCKCTTCIASMEAEPGKPDKVVGVRKIHFPKKT